MIFCSLCASMYDVVYSYADACVSTHYFSSRLVGKIRTEFSFTMRYRITAILLLAFFLCGQNILPAKIAPDIFPSLRKETRFSLGLKRSEINDALYIYFLRHTNPWAYLRYEVDGTSYLDYSNFQALKLEIDFGVSLPGGLYLSSYVPFFTIKELPDPGFNVYGERVEGRRVAAEGLRLGDVRFQLSLERSLRRCFSRLSLGVKLPTGEDPYELEEPLMATGTGSRDLLFGVSGGLRLWALSFALGIEREQRSSLRRNAYLYLRSGPQEIDPGDVTTGSLGVRANLFRDGHQDVFLSSTYYYRAQAAERTQEQQWAAATDTHYIVTELSLLFRQELLVSAATNFYGIRYDRSTSRYRALLSWSLRVSLLFG